MKIKRLLLTVLLPLISVGILFAVLNGIPQVIFELKGLTLSWLLYPLIIIVGAVIVTILYKVLDLFGDTQNDKN